MTKHLPYGGSTAKRTLGCNGWAEKSKNVTPRPAGPAAIEGSMHHAIMEMCQTNGTLPASYVGFKYVEPGNGDLSQEFTDDDITLSEIAHTATEKLLNELDIDEMEIEPFVQMVEDKAGGSIDVLGLSDDRKTLLILDYKFGYEKVIPDKNPQCGVYGVSVMRDPSTADLFADVEKIVFAIVQPRIKGVVSKWDCDVAWLVAFEKKFLKAMKGKKIVPGSHCKYCPAEAFCEERRLSIHAATLLGARQLTELQKAADMIEEVDNWVKSMREELYLQLSRGVGVKGWKIIDKRANRRWDDEDKVAGYLKGKMLKKDFSVTALLSPSKMEKLLKKKKIEFNLDDFTIWESSGTTLALEGHKSPAVVVSDVIGHLEEIMMETEKG